jgi:hypothetical protein
MQKIQLNQGIGVALLITCAAWMTSVSLAAFQNAKPEDFSGTWQLNEGASTNPGGPSPNAPPAGPASAGRRGGGVDAGNKADRLAGGVANSAVAAVDTQFSAEEQKRTLAELKLMQAVPAKLMIQASAKEFNLTYEGGSQAVTFPHVPDGKKVKITAVPTFEKLKIESKVQWSNGVFKREMTTPDSLTVNEEYTLSPDGKQLTVVLAAKSGMWRIPDAANPRIKRVYDRVQ